MKQKYKIILITLIALGVMGCNDTSNQAPLSTVGEVTKLYKGRECCIAVVWFEHNSNRGGEKISFKVSCQNYKVGDKIKFEKL